MAQRGVMANAILTIFFFALFTVAFVVDSPRHLTGSYENAAVPIEIPDHLRGVNQRADLVINKARPEIRDLLVGDAEARIAVNATRVERRAPATTFDEAVATGCTRLNWMQGSATGPATQWNAYAQLEQNDWLVFESSLNFLPQDLNGAFTALQYSTANADNPVISAFHSGTGGNYQVLYNTLNGAIVALFTESPQRAAPNTPPPALSQLSDVAWLIWQEQIMLQKRNIARSVNTIFVYHIATPTTTAIISQVLTNLGMTDYAGNWPGVLVTELPAIENLQALIGTTAGSLPSYLLAQHKAALGGNPYVSAVNIFGYSSQTGYNLAYRISYV